MKWNTLIFGLLAIALIWIRLFHCAYVPFTADVKLLMALAHEINGAALGAALVLWLAREYRLGWIYFGLWLVPGLVEGTCFALRVSH